MRADDYQATVRLLRLNLRQNRVFLACWAFIPGLLVMATAFTTIAMFPTRESLLGILPTLQDPMVVGIHGKVLAISVAGYTAWRTKVLCSLLAAIFSFVMVIRRTRRDEEEGRRELLGGVRVGRQAPLAAALLAALLVNIVMAGLILLGMLAAGLGFTGSLAHAAAILACACFFAAAAAVLAQIFTSARTVNALSTILLVLLMAPHIGWNVKGSMGGVMYLSPLEWPFLIRAFAGERFAVLLIAALMIGLLAFLAFKLSARREYGAGFIPERTGRAVGRPGFKSAWALSWRMQKGSFWFWLFFLAFIGFMLGSVSQTLANISSTAPSLAGFVERLGGTDRAFMSLMIYEIALLIGIYPILALQQARAEESYLRADTLLALPVSRLRYYLSHLLFAFAGTAAIMSAMGLTLGVGAAVATGDSGEFTRLLIETMVKIPAVWVVAGIASLLFGLIPRGMTGISFTVLGIFILLEFFYEQGAVSQALFYISPFAQVYPTNPITALPVIGLLSASSLLVFLGGLAYQRRDVVS